MRCVVCVRAFCCVRVLWLAADARLLWRCRSQLIVVERVLRRACACGVSALRIAGHSRIRRPEGVGDERNFVQVSKSANGPRAVRVRRGRAARARQRARLRCVERCAAGRWRASRASRSTAPAATEPPRREGRDDFATPFVCVSCSRRFAALASFVRRTQRQRERSRHGGLHRHAHAVDEERRDEGCACDEFLLLLLCGRCC